MDPIPIQGSAPGRRAKHYEENKTKKRHMKINKTGNKIRHIFISKPKWDYLLARVDDFGSYSRILCTKAICPSVLGLVGGRYSGKRQNTGGVYGNMVLDYCEPRIPPVRSVLGPLRFVVSLPACISLRGCHRLPPTPSTGPPSAPGEAAAGSRVSLWGGVRI